MANQTAGNLKYNAGGADPEELSSVESTVVTNALHASVDKPAKKGAKVVYGRVFGNKKNHDSIDPLMKKRAQK